jgi:hypothetical protein
MTAIGRMYRYGASRPTVVPLMKRPLDELIQR